MKKVNILTASYNEEAVIFDFLAALKDLDQVLEVDYSFVVTVVDDGSTDHTQPEILRAIRELNEPGFKIDYIGLSRNFGKESALTCGLKEVTSGPVIIMDCDFQDPIELVPEMIRLWDEEGYENVLPYREHRKSDSWMKRYSASVFYRAFNLLSDRAIPENVGDFRLIGEKVVVAVNQMPESTRFMKGILSWPGFEKKLIPFERPSRKSGETKFNAGSLLRLAADGIFSFSTTPLRVLSFIGAVLSVMSALFLGYILISHVFYGNDVAGWTSIASLVLLLGSIQILGIGVLGEYIARIFKEVKRRPTYIIDEKIRTSD